MRAAATGVARLLASRGERYAERRVDGVEGPRPPPRHRGDGVGRVSFFFHTGKVEGRRRDAEAARDALREAQATAARA